MSPVETWYDSKDYSLNHQHRQLGTLVYYTKVSKTLTADKCTQKADIKFIEELHVCTASLTRLHFKG